MANNAAKVTLHWLNGSRSQRILWLLTELDVPYELKVYHRGALNLAPPELKKLHPLGKAPLVTVVPPPSTTTAGGHGDAKPIVLAESPFIIEYLCAHWGGQAKGLVPAKWRAGREGAVGGETAAWLRHQYLLYESEGSFMPYLLVQILMGGLKANTPWFLRPVTSAIADKVNSIVTLPNVRDHLRMFESFLAAPPDDDATDTTDTTNNTGGYLCGARLSAADILMSFPLLAARDHVRELGPWVGGSADKEFPLTFAYLARLEAEPGYRKAVAKIEEVEGSYSLLPE